jgi:poly(A) polymerase
VKAIKRVIQFCKKALGSSDSNNSTSAHLRVYRRDQHPVSRKLISPNAQKVLYRLSNAGFDAYLVGGGVRDILLGITPKDFDIATNATPEQIKGLFRNCRIIGRRFKLAHILFGREIIEVATFRGHHNADTNDATAKTNDHGMLLRDNIYGTIDEDAERRDFTINALYYNIADYCVYDFWGGVEDIHNRTIKLIGDPETRYREDPVRMLRAIRFAVKLNMTIAPATLAPIATLHPLLANIPAARMFEEFNKLFLSGQGEQTFLKLREQQLFQYFFPITDTLLNKNTQPLLLPFILQALKNSDQRIADDQRVTPAFLLAVFLWQPFIDLFNHLKQTETVPEQDLFYQALDKVLSAQQSSIAIPKRFQSVIKDIWLLQTRLPRREGKRAEKLIEHPKFRAGYDFLLLRAQSGEKDCEELAKWWTIYQQSSYHVQQQMVKSLAKGTSRKPRRHLRKKQPNRRKKPQDNAL